MDLRPAPARWFEIVVPTEDAHDTMEVLARRGRVQFEWKGEHSVAAQLEPLREPIAGYRTFARQFERFWPEPVFEARCCTLPVEIAAQAAIRQIERWREAAGPLLERLNRLQRQQQELDLWRPLLASLAISGSSFDFGALAAAGPVLAGYALLLPEAGEPPGPSGALWAETRFEDKRALLGLIPRDDLPLLCERARARGADCLSVPDWFAGTADECSAELPYCIMEQERQAEHLEQELRKLAEDLGIDHAAGVLERLDWFQRTAENISCDSRYCWITGWTSEEDSGAINRALREVGVESSVEFVEPPQDASLPSVTRNPAWLQPFEVFTHAVGVPGVREADPTTWVALLVPLMFGYMCGDIGHGAVILTAGLLLRGRTELWPLFLFCGIASMGFGFAYGDVFGFEHLIEPLWVHPLAQPFTLLLVPVVAGALVLTVGVLLHFVQTCWRGQGRSEGVADVAQLLVYWGIILAFLDVRFGWLCLAGASLCIVNRLWTERSATALLIGIGQQIQNTFELLLNTLSFARVGAFALAHAALESAVIAIADGVSTLAVAVVIIVVGNLLVIVVEGLVVGIQTTRLVLFEFFMRFFEGTGQRFQPASLPPTDARTKDGRDRASRRRRRSSSPSPPGRGPGRGQL
ncbi:MAG: V-type ATPase 116kDa subunit family protein [Pseudomonadota bacterium]|nr:V-type ATPase 116kDa subunit family protein [Pseudomonadota bacterium]